MSNPNVGIKTQYKNCEFGECTPGSLWVCVNSSDPEENFGYVRLRSTVDEWAFEPNYDKKLSAEFLNEVIHFMGQLSQNAKAD
jgi:hypothetical protein